MRQRLRCLQSRNTNHTLTSSLADFSSNTQFKFKTAVIPKKLTMASKCGPFSLLFFVIKLILKNNFCQNPSSAKMIQDTSRAQPEWNHDVRTDCRRAEEIVK